MLTASDINAVVQRIVARADPQTVIVFGSYAKGQATSRSDLDLFIIKETPLPMANRADELKAVFLGGLIAVDVHVYTPEEVEAYGQDPTSFVNSILSTGKIVFEKLGPERPKMITLASARDKRSYPS
jgi:predicted nucleotidyltransferase